MGNQTELTEKVNTLTTKVEKIGTEVDKLKEAIANQPNVTPELQAAVDSLEAALGVVDDKNEDAATA